MKLVEPTGGEAEAPRFRSRFGGLWTDCSDAHVLLAERLSSGQVTEAEAESLAHYIDQGYVVLPQAVDEEVIDEYVEFFERSWDDAPRSLTAICQGTHVRVSRQLYDEVAKVSCLHWFYPKAAEIIFPPTVFRFLTLLYERPPVVFQTMSMRKGSEEPLHIDTGPLTLTEPMSMVASWLALEDIKPHSGELEFVPGTHRLPEVLNHGVSKGHNGDMVEYARVLERIREISAERGLVTERFAATKGDVLIWHADLMHGGAKIEDPNSTRQSLVAHFMPLGVMPNFYDYSQVSAVPYSNGGYSLDNYKFKTTPDPPATGLRRAKNRIPLGVRTFARNQVDRVRTPQS